MSDRSRLSTKQQVGRDSYESEVKRAIVCDQELVIHNLRADQCIPEWH
jgi:hypothetical protein